MRTQALFYDDAYLSDCEATVIAVSDAGFITDRSIFYPTAGGQPGDTGLVEFGGSSCPIADCKKFAETGGIEHLLDLDAQGPTVGDRVVLRLNWEKRYRAMRMHSCLHLLCRAVDGPVTGGNIGDGKGRLDFDLPDAKIDKEAIARIIHGWIEDDRKISARWIDDAALKARPELVRTMSVKPPMGRGRVRLIEIDGVDLQACGGTHVRSTSEIGRIRIGKVEKKGRQNRRVQILFD